MLTMTHSTLAAERYYKITYAPGVIATFKDSLINEYKEKYGTQNVVQSQITGAITITVAAKQAMPNAPTANDIEYKENQTQYYVLTSGWQPASTQVTENATYVVQYGTLINDVEYTIRYVDRTSNIDIETPVIARANKDEALIAYAKVIDGYTFDTQTKSIVLGSDAAQNVITFYYTNEGTSNEQQVVDNVVINTVRPTTPTTPVQQGEPIVNVPENQTPQANAGDDQTVNIDDNQTPQFQGELERNNQKLYTTIVGVIILLVVAIGYVVFKRKNKKA